MPEFPSELVEAAAKAQWHQDMLGVEDARPFEESSQREAYLDDARAVLSAVAPLEGNG